MRYQYLASALGALLATSSAAPLSEPTTASDTNGDKYSLTEVGARNTLDWRIYLNKDGSPASFWHDVPLYPDSGNSSVINFVVEIPRWTDAKIEIKRDEPLSELLTI